MSEQRIAILGGTGFIGQHLACELTRRRYTVRILTRRRERKRGLLVIPELELVEADVYSATALSAALEGCAAIINLVGILNSNPSPGQNFQDVHARLPEIISEAARCNRIPLILHMSALNATPDAPSEYLRSKAAGENHLHEAADSELQVTSFRPSVVFGPGDNFFNLFAQLLAKSPLLFPLACAGTRFAPVFAADVARAMVDSLDNKERYGQRYDLCGPKIYTLEELVRFTAQLTGVNPWILPLGEGLARLQAEIMEKLPGQLFSMDNFLSMQVDSVSDDNALPKLHIEAQSIENIVPGYLSKHSPEQVMNTLRMHAGRS